MAVALIRKESIPQIFKGSTETNWMRYVIKKMMAPSLEKFADNNVAFFTFNYDRSLEQFLSTSLMNAYGASESEVGAVLRKMTIVHLHGQLGYLPWQSSDDVRRFSIVIDPTALVVCERCIKLYHEDMSDALPKFEKAKEWLGDATANVYFMGVGFDNQNMERLGVGTMPPSRAWSTGVGLTDKEARDLTDKLGNQVSVIRHYPCMQLVNNRVEWD